MKNTINLKAQQSKISQKARLRNELRTCTWQYGEAKPKKMVTSGFEYEFSLIFTIEYLVVV